MIYRFIKRIFDFVFAFVALLVLTPLMLPIMVLLRLTGEGYIFYRQRRVGYKNRSFEILKFATMLKDSPNMKGGAITTDEDPRILPMGHFLRKTKVNELPQLINVLKGEMSFVGPRPLMREQSFELYSADVKKTIYNVRPGITGLGSLIFRDESGLISSVATAGGDPKLFYRNVIFPHKGNVEQWYQANQSFYLDFIILVCTAISLFVPRSGIIYFFFSKIPRENLVQLARNFTVSEIEAI